VLANGERVRAILLLTVFVSLALIGSGCSSQRSSYERAAKPLLEQLEKLSAFVETGLTIGQYRERVGELNYAWKKFDEQITDLRALASYQALSDAVNSYKEAEAVWNSGVRQEDIDAEVRRRWREVEIPRLREKFGEMSRSDLDGYEKTFRKYEPDSVRAGLEKDARGKLQAHWIAANTSIKKAKDALTAGQ